MSDHDYELNTLEVIRKITLLDRDADKDNREALTGREYHCLTTLLIYRNSKYFQCNPSYQRLSEDMACSRSSVQSAVDGLRRKKFIQVTKRNNKYDGHNTSMQFWIMADINKIHAAMDDDDAIEFIEKAQKIDVIECYKKHFQK